MKAHLSRSRGRFMATFVFVGLALWAARHVLDILQIGSISAYIYQNWVFLFSFLMVLIAIGLAYREKPYKGSSYEADDKFVTAVVPAYNEDPEALRACLRSLIEQSRPLQEIYLIDDGSNKTEYSAVSSWFTKACDEKGIIWHWIRRENGGKRHAQSHAFEAADKADIFVTVDSDSILDDHAIEELMKPFADPNVQSVAGVVLALNNRTNLLARITDLLFVTGQLIDRSMMSSLGSVLVNSGGLAAYRADVVRSNLRAYLNETFFGRHIEFSDDSMLTLYSLQRGKTVQQPTAFVFTMMPDQLSHHVRQQTRWMKGSFIRSWWRLKYLPLNSFGFLRQAIGWAQFVMTTVFLALVLIFHPHVNQALIPYFIIAPILIGYAQALRYFSVKRSDETIGSQIITYLLTPLAILWSYFVLRPIRVYASLTCFNSKWGTRQAVEVTLNNAPALPAARTLPLYGFYIETHYEALVRAITKSCATQEQAVAAWQRYYDNLSDKQKLVLWKDFYKLEARRPRSKNRNIILRLRQVPNLSFTA